MNIKNHVTSCVTVAVVAIAGSGCMSTGVASTPTVSAAEAERAACAEIPDADRDQGPFARHDRILRVEELREKPNTKAAERPVGAAVYVRAIPGMTEQWLGRVIECNRAHHAAAGDLVADRDSPLFTDDARISVSATATAFRVSITSADVDVARSIYARASRLTVQ